MRELRKLGDIEGYHLHARDGEVGTLRELYFDDRRWQTRYFVVETGSWLLGRDVLIVPSVVTGIDTEGKRLEVDLSREQIREAPPVETQLPVSQHYEQEYYRYYDWEPYWSGDPLFGPLPSASPPGDQAPREPQNPHLRSSGEVLGYRILARDGEIGRVSDLVLEDTGWALRYFEVDIGNWLAGKYLLFAPAWIESIDWSTKDVVASLDREAIRTAPTYDPAQTISRDYELALYKHYGMELVED
ncbi:MAG: PRC-barrel domain-containing protein [Chromatocurvus sp.]